jgi:hypothetical protein
MPWRRDYSEALWIDPDYTGLAGFPGEANNTSPTQQQAERQMSDVREAVLVMRDRIGFQYERRVGLGDFVSQRDAAKLLSIDVMTVTRWVKAKKLPSRKRKGFVVVRLRDVVEVARKQEIPLPLHFLLVVQTVDLQERNWYPTGGSR